MKLSCGRAIPPGVLISASFWAISVFLWVHFYFLLVVVGGAVSYPLLFEQSIFNLLLYIQVHVFLAHVAECGYSRTPGRFFLFWYNRNMVISISIPGSRNRFAQLNQWHMVIFSSSQILPVRGRYPLL